MKHLIQIVVLSALLAFALTGCGSPMSATTYTAGSATSGVGSPPPPSPPVMPSPTSSGSGPSNLIATASAATIVQLAWTDNSSNVNYFKIERSSDGGATFNLIGTSSASVASYEDFNLNPQTNYIYRILAATTAGDSAPSANSTVTTLAAGNTSTFTYISVNIIAPNCAGCHGGANPSAGINLSAYAGVKGLGQTLYNVIANGTMPPGGAVISATQLSQIQAWINSGSPNN